MIRGLGGDRIRVLQGGLGTADASNTSPDHAVSFDPLAARQIEVVRGPATLLYGSNAVGGVVNVIDGTHPGLGARPSALRDGRPGGRHLGGRAQRARRALRRARALRLARGLSSKRETDDVAIPGFAESAALRAEEEAEGEEHEEGEGRAGEQRDRDRPAAARGLAVVGHGGFLGVAFCGFDTLYGVPGHEHAHGEEGGARARRRPSASTSAARGWTCAASCSARSGRSASAGSASGRSDYEHVELEGEEVGTRFTNEAWEGRLELPHAPLGPVHGSSASRPRTATSRPSARRPSCRRP